MTTHDSIVARMWHARDRAGWRNFGIAILALTVAFLGPALAIYGIDILLRRNRYNGLELHDETPRSRFWYWSGLIAVTPLK